MLFCSFGFRVFGCCYPSMTEEPAEGVQDKSVTSTTGDNHALETKPYVKQITFIEYKESTLHSLEGWLLFTTPLSFCVCVSLLFLNEVN